MGLLRTASRMAVATSVHGKVRRRQAQRWAAEDQAAAASVPAPPPVAPPAPPQPAAPGPDALSANLALLTQLGELRAAGVLTEAEFQAKKAQILAG